MSVPSTDPGIQSADITQWGQLLHLMNHNQPELVPDFDSPKLFWLAQTGFNFRAASYASDEPICIATLLGLDLGKILGASKPEDDEPIRTEQRMCMLWRLIAEADQGIPSQVLFVGHDRLRTPGMRWAPKSLLGRQGALDARLSEQPPVMGFLTPRGFAVDMPGLLLKPHALLPDFPLHPWDSLARPLEHVVYFYDPFSDKWYKMGAHGPPATAPSGSMGSESSSRPLCDAIDSGQIALIKQEEAHPHQAVCWLMVQIMDSPTQPSWSEKPGYHVRYLRRVVVTELDGQELVILRILRRIAWEVASTPATQEYLQLCETTDLSGEIFQQAKAFMLGTWKNATDSWFHFSEFATAVEQSMGSAARNYIWASAIGRVSHDRLAFATPPDQRWFVD